MPTAAEEYVQTLSRQSKPQVVGSKEYLENVHYHWEMLNRPEHTMTPMPMAKIEHAAVRYGTGLLIQ